nr:hypothetical protein [Cressdnaviricota sp.]
MNNINIKIVKMTHSGGNTIPRVVCRRRRRHIEIYSSSRFQFFFDINFFLFQFFPFPTVSLYASQNYMNRI